MESAWTSRRSRSPEPLADRGLIRRIRSEEDRLRNSLRAVTAFRRFRRRLVDRPTALASGIKCTPKRLLFEGAHGRFEQRHGAILVGARYVVVHDLLDAS